MEALRIQPLYKSIDDLTAVIAARDSSIAEHHSSTAALQTKIEQLDEGLESKRGKKQAYKIAFAGKVCCSHCRATCCPSLDSVCNFLRHHANCVTDVGWQPQGTRQHLEWQPHSIAWAGHGSTAQLLDLQVVSLTCILPLVTPQGHSFCVITIHLNGVSGIHHHLSLQFINAWLDMLACYTVS